MYELSIIIPIYNVESYLEECLNSIYSLKVNKEVILVNDESPDKSFLIIEKYKKMYPNETKVIDQKNKGLSGARNSGLKIANGNYVAFIDSDDFIDTKKYENFFKSSKDKNLDIIIGTYRKYKDKNYLEVCQRNKSIANLGIVTGKKFLEESLKFDSFREEVWDDIYRREFLINNNLLFKEKLLHEDTLFFIQALVKAKRVQYFDIPFYIYRQREGSIMSMISYKNHQHRVYIVKELIDLQNNLNFSLKGLNIYLLNILWTVFKLQNEVNLNLLNQIIKIERLLTFKIKDYIKVLIMFVSKIKCKTIKPIELGEESC